VYGQQFGPTRVHIGAQFGQFLQLRLQAPDLLLPRGEDAPVGQQVALQLGRVVALDHQPQRVVVTTAQVLSAQQAGDALALCIDARLGRADVAAELVDAQVDALLVTLELVQAPLRGGDRLF
jgi:hypothetical protein